MLSFAWPLVFLLAPLPWLAYRGLPRAAEDQSALRMPLPGTLAGIQRQTVSLSRRRQRNRLLLLLPLWLLLLCAAARPQWVGEPLPMAPSGRDLLLAVDISGSMGTEDMPEGDQLVDRLQVVKRVLADFVERRSGDRLGLILFGTRAYLQAPLTFDNQTVIRLLRESALGLAGERTAIGDAIGLAIKRLDLESESSRVLVLMTDGANTAGEVAPQKAAQLAADRGLKIYTIGIGADQDIETSWFGIRRRNPSAQLDEESLRAIAQVSGGRYFRARDSEELEQIYRELDALEPMPRDSEKLRPASALFVWPLGIALALAAVLALPGFGRLR